MRIEQENDKDLLSRTASAPFDRARKGFRRQLQEGHYREIAARAVKIESGRSLLF